MNRLIWFGHLGLAIITLLAYASPYIPPSIFWPASFASLAYPSLLICHLLLGGFWIYRGQRRWLLSAVIIAIGYSHVLELIGFNTPEKAEKSITFATYNLLGGKIIYKSDSLALRQNLRQFTSCIKVDVVAFEESPRYMKLGKWMEDALAEHGLKHTFRSEKTNVTLHSKFPLIQAKLYKDYNATNGVITALIAPNSKDTMLIIAAHLQSNKVILDAGDLMKDAAKANKQAYWTVRNVARNYRAAAIDREDQAAELAKLIRASKHPVVLIGDLNDTPLSYTIGTLKRAGLVDAFRQNGSGLGITYPGTIPGLRIDYVLASPSLKPISAGVLNCDYSDHKPTLASFALN